MQNIEEDLNTVWLPNKEDDVPPWSVQPEDNSVKVVTPSCESYILAAYFDQLEDRLVNHIKRADIILGCVAWLTNGVILDVLSQKKGVSIIVQKEDFLRPDLGSSSRWESELHQKYDALPGGIHRQKFGSDNVLSVVNYNDGNPIDPIRCVGNYNQDKHPAHPRMHNKFLLFGHRIASDEGSDELRMFGVWTGSFNFTHSATKSLENAIFTTERSIVHAFYKEYTQIAAISEQLNWRTPWVAPEWSIGT